MCLLCIVSGGRLGGVLDCLVLATSEVLYVDVRWSSGSPTPRLEIRAPPNHLYVSKVKSQTLKGGGVYI